MKEKISVIRPQVAKNEKLFTNYVRQYGSDMVREVLSKGQSGPMKLKVMTNRKDRHQMLQLLGLLD